MYRSGGIYTLKKMEEEIDLYFFRCYDEDKYDQRRVKMKKILASLMMVGLIFCLGGCNVPWMKQKTEKTKAAKVIQADKVEGTMKGMKLKVGVSNHFHIMIVSRRRSQGLILIFLINLVNIWALNMNYIQ